MSIADERGKMASSCVGCKWLYKRDEGYSNYTVEETTVICAQGKNAMLPADKPYDWKEDATADNWDKTKNGRCELYANGPCIHLDVDGEVTPEEFTDDAEVIALIRNMENPAAAPEPKP